MAWEQNRIQASSNYFLQRDVQFRNENIIAKKLKLSTTYIHFIQFPFIWIIFFLENPAEGFENILLELVLHFLICYSD